jgi:hypothetical protein
MPINFKRELFVFRGGGGGTCFGPLTDTLPSISVDQWPWPDPNRLASICLYGFLAGERVSLEVYNGLSLLVGSENYTIGEGRIDLGAGREISMVEIPVSLPISRPRAEWRIVASAPSGGAQTSFSVGGEQTNNPLQAPLLTADHDAHTDAYNPLNPGWLAPFQPGGIAWLEGQNFPILTNLELGFYRGTGHLEYLDAMQVQTDGQGSFITEIRIDPTFASGDYAVIPITFLSEGSDDVSDTSYARFKIQAEEARLITDSNCDNAHWSQLTIGERATLVDDMTNNLRMYPGINEDVAGSLRPGEVVILLNGPECSNEFIWWYVHVVDSGLLGWTVEGEDQDVWLIPIQ